MKAFAIWMAVVFWGHFSVSASFTPEEARRVYGEVSSSLSSNSFTEVGGYLFADVRWSITKDATSEDREEHEMSALMEVIEKYVTPSPVVCTNSPFCKALTTWLVPEIEYRLPKVDTSVVKNDETNGQIRQVIAFDVVALKKARLANLGAANRVNERTDDDWLLALKEASTKFKTAAEKRRFNLMLGCSIVNFIHCQGECRLEKFNDDEKLGVAELERFSAWRPMQDSVFSKYPDLLWSTHKSNGAKMFYPKWSEDDGGRFSEAKDLYRQGKDIQRILRLLSESICMNPIGARKWLYLGGALKVSNQFDDALFAYVQALKFNDDDPLAWKGLRDCCQKLGMKANAAGLEWYFKLNGIK